MEQLSSVSDIPLPGEELKHMIEIDVSTDINPKSEVEVYEDTEVATITNEPSEIIIPKIEDIKIDEDNVEMQEIDQNSIIIEEQVQTVDQTVHASEVEISVIHSEEVTSEIEAFEVPNSEVQIQTTIVEDMATILEAPAMEVEETVIIHNTETVIIQSEPLIESEQIVEEILPSEIVIENIETSQVHDGETLVETVEDLQKFVEESTKDAAEAAIVSETCENFVEIKAEDTSMETDIKDEILSDTLNSSAETISQIQEEIIVAVEEVSKTIEQTNDTSIPVPSEEIPITEQIPESMIVEEQPLDTIVDEDKPSDENKTDENILSESKIVEEESAESNIIEEEDIEPKILEVEDTESNIVEEELSKLNLIEEEPLDTNILIEEPSEPVVVENKSPEPVEIETKPVKKPAKKNIRTNSTIEAIKNEWTETLTIEEINAEMLESLPAQEAQREPVVVEPEEKTEPEPVEHSETITEVIVLENVNEEMTLNLDQNVTIEIIDNMKEKSGTEEELITMEIVDGSVIEPQEPTAEKNKSAIVEEKTNENTGSVAVSDSTNNNEKVNPPSTNSSTKRVKERVTRSTRRFKDDTHSVPCHLLGRNIDNPTEDLVSNGRTPPKPRLGVKVPYRFLTSQIVSKQEIADELIELHAKRNPEPDHPIGGDIFFKQKLTQRLASKISMNETKRKNKSAADALTIKTSSVATPIIASAKTSVLSSSGIPDDALSTPPMTASSTSTSSKTITDNSDLLAILEGDVDVDLTKEIRKQKNTGHRKLSESDADGMLTPEKVLAGIPQKQDTPVRTITQTSYINRKGLDPELERKIALKQLKSLPRENNRRSGRRSNYVDKYVASPIIKKEPVVEVKPKPAAVQPKVQKEPSEQVKQTAELVLGKIKEKTADISNKLKEENKEEKKDKSVAAKEERKLISLKDKLKDDKKDKPSSKEKEEKTKHAPENPKIIEPDNDVIELMSPKKVTKTYSRKEAVLDVPADLEYIVNETFPSALEESVEETAPKGETKETTVETNPKENSEVKQDETEIKDTKNKEKIVKKVIQKSPVKKSKRPVTDINNPEITLVSKRARIIKRKVIWDPAEVPKPRALVVKKTRSVDIKQSITKAIEKPTKKRQSTEENVEPPQDDKKTKEPEKATKSDEPKTKDIKPEIKTKVVPIKQKPKSLKKAKLLPRSLHKVQKKKILMKRQLRSLRGKLIRSTNGELKSSIALSKKKKQVIAEIAKKVKPKKTELDKLLMDEGAVNMLYSVRQDDKFLGKKKKATLLSRKDLLNRTKALRDVITQSSNQEDSTKALRKKDSPILAPIQISSPPRKKSRDSIRSSLQSPPPSPSYMYPHRAEASRIIRRHSNSFSSECSSPRRLSIDNQQTTETPTTTIAEATKPEVQEDSAPKKETVEFQSPMRTLRRKGVPIFERKLDEKNTYKGKKKLLPETDQKEPESKEEIKDKEVGERLAPKTEKEKLTVTEKRKLSAEMSKNFGKTPSPKKRTRNSKISEDEQQEEPAATKEEDVKTKAGKANKKTAEEIDEEKPLQQRMTTRQISVTNEYKEISLKKIDNLVQIILTPSCTKLKNSMNLQMFSELCSILQQLSKDDSCRVVLMTSTDSSFCHGVDFSTLIQSSAEKRLAAAQEMAGALKEFLRNLARFPKPLIAGVQGSAVGLGVTMLPLFDLVFASDKATFSTPYGRLGQVPEGIAFLTLPHLLGTTLTSELMFASRKLTASEAVHHGLVTRTLWPDKFQEELVSNAITIASQSLQCMTATKSLLRQSLLSKLEEALDCESKLLICHWSSAECQQNFKKLVHEEEWW